MVGAAGLIAAAAITPGPNNLIVLRMATHFGFLRSLPAIAGIVAGGLAMLVLVTAGGAAVFSAEPHLYSVIAIGGGAYLCWLGASLVMGSFGKSDAHQTTQVGALPIGAAGLFGFQFLNPKTWVMVLTVTAAVQGGAEPSRTFLRLATLFTVIPALCLVVWCVIGVVMTTYLDRPVVRIWLDRAMGVLLIVSALLMVFMPVDVQLP